MARTTKTDPAQPPARGALAPAPATGSSSRVGSKRVAHRKYRMHVRGDIPSDLSGRVSAAHASAIHGRPKAERDTERT